MNLASISLPEHPMAFYIARRSRTNPHLPDTLDLSTATDGPLSEALAYADHRSGVPRTFRVWHHRGDTWFELTALDFRLVEPDHWEAGRGALRFVIEKRADGWHAYGWQGSGPGWNPRPFTHRASAEAWCSDGFGAHETAADAVRG